MKISRNNYEAFFLDYLEGNLEEIYVDEFIEFLQQNPDLKEELENFRAIAIDSSEEKFPNKKNLYKEKYDSVPLFNNTSVGFLENDLTESERSEFEEYLNKHPEKQKDFQLFQKTKLVADDSVIFKKKSSLRKSTTAQKLWAYTIRIAAILILVFAFSVLLRQHSEIETPPPQIVKLEQNNVLPKNELPQKPQKEVKKETEKIQVKPLVKDTIKAEPVKSIRENNKGRIKGDDFVVIERDTLVPKTIGMKNIQLASVQPELTLDGFDLLPNSISDDFLMAEENLLIGEKIIDAAGINRFRLNDITKAGLKLFSGLSKNKFTYDTNEQGEITELNLDTRLLAFSIPTKGNPR
ncbi:MAG: hypothetical protein JXR31_13205 [Prolixibacteraceae bacterium]|nr:hypothetical protein [Prolixibacteraceae bacterium]MBN2775207.1 hypothetical protein [Prolixibacteraceae bacterium]